MSVQEFVVTKARNMKNWLSAFATTDEQKDLLNQYDEGKIIPIVLTMLLPLYHAGQLDTAVEEFMGKLGEVPDPQSVKDKIRRYLECFCEALAVVPDSVCERKTDEHDCCGK